jgi:hypothetical protein
MAAKNRTATRKVTARRRPPSRSANQPVSASRSTPAPTSFSCAARSALRHSREVVDVGRSLAADRRQRSNRVATGQRPPRPPHRAGERSVRLRAGRLSKACHSGKPAAHLPRGGFFVPTVALQGHWPLARWRRQISHRTSLGRFVSGWALGAHPLLEAGSLPGKAALSPRLGVRPVDDTVLPLIGNAIPASRGG